MAGAVGWVHHWNSTRSAAKAKLPSDNSILARVGKTTISAYDLDLAAEVGFSKKTRREFEQGPARKQLLESLIHTRAIALVREAELSDEEKLELEKLVARAREDILVKQYLTKHAEPDLVTSEEMRAYYDAHREEFGGGSVRLYEIVTSETRLVGGPRDEVIRELSKASGTPDWFEWTKKLRAQGKPVVHYRAELAAKMMKPQLASVAERLNVGQSTEVTMVDGMPYIVRLISATPGAAKSYESVAEEIRERLSPRVLTKAAKRAAAEALKQVEVTRY